ncbi:unnamed protein product [Clavelina lepadiformis]|uniref:Uncharacterized protein n=1 Tax=Clavelina lepadiformis TaxID=159417 RepID=A0ABP0G7Q8_CLALP
MDRCRKHPDWKHRTETAIVWPESLTHSQLRSLPELPTHDVAECFDKLLRLITQSFEERTDNTDMLTSDLSLVDFKPSQLMRLTVTAPETTQCTTRLVAIAQHAS